MLHRVEHLTHWRLCRFVRARPEKDGKPGFHPDMKDRAAAPVDLLLNTSRHGEVRSGVVPGRSDALSIDDHPVGPKPIPPRDIRPVEAN